MLEDLYGYPQDRLPVLPAHPQGLKQNPRARIIVTGCYAQVASEAVAQIPGVSLVLGNAEKCAIADFIAQDTESSSVRVGVSDLSRESRFTDPPLRTFPNHTRAFLKVQDGCESFCTFCIVPYARSRCRSLPPREVLTRLFTLSAAGFKEVVLRGIHLGAYGTDLTPPSNLLALLQLIDTGAFSSKVGAEDLAKFPAIIGHTRYKTVGAVTKDNAHPYHIGSIIGAHNGCIWNEKDLRD